MNYLASKLKYRIEIRKGVQEPNDIGGFDRSYEVLKTIWAEVKESKSVSSGFIAAIRGQTVNNSPSHEFIVRQSSIISLGKEFGSSPFATDFNSVSDVNPIKADYFIFLKANGNTGRLFKIIGTKRDEANKDKFCFKAKEIEEHGTGYEV